MAVGSRSLKLSILGDVDQLKKSLSEANAGVESSAGKIGDFSKKVGAAFAVAGAAAAAYAGKLLIDGVKAAIEDEAAQAKLATTLQNVTNATKKQIEQVEKYITKTTLASGITDDKLRPAFDRLVRSTKSVDQAQKLTNLAMDISVGTGKDLQTISEALAKAYDGNVTALGKLGIEVKKTIVDSAGVTKAHEAVEKATNAVAAAELKFGINSEKGNAARAKLEEATTKLGDATGKTKEVNAEFSTIMDKLTDTFGGQASTAAETFQGKMTRLQVAFDEGKETVGAFVLDAITPLVSAFVSKAVPAITAAADSIGKELQPVFKTLGDYFKEVLVPAFKALYDFINDYVVPILKVTLVPIITAVFDAFGTIAKALKDNETNLKPLADAFEVLAKFLRDTIAPILGKFVSGAITGIADVITGLIDVASSVTKAVTAGFKAVKDFFVDIKDYLATSAKTIFTPLYDGMKAVLNGIIGIWNKLDFAIDITVPDWVPIVGGKGFKVADIFPDIPLLAKGGIVNSPTLAMIGEAGPEAVVPLNGSGGFGNTYNITVNGAVDSEGTARQIVNLLNNSFYRGTGGATALVTS